MSEQQPPDPMTDESDGEILRIDSKEWSTVEFFRSNHGEILRIDSKEWSTVEFFRSNHDGSLCIEIKDAEQTWLTVAEAQQLRDWLIKVLT